MKLFENLRGRSCQLTLLAAFASLVNIGWDTAAYAQEQSMEERLRTQLRAVTAQLQQAQNELAVLKSGAGSTVSKAATAPDAQALRIELEQARQQLEKERDMRARQGAQTHAMRQQARDSTEKANAQVQQFRSAYDGLLKMARTELAERQRLAEAASAQQAAMQRCEVKNQQLYALGQEVLQAYENLDMSTLLSFRQPFATQSRVRFDEIAQQYGDKLYMGKFSPDEVDAPQSQ